MATSAIHIRPGHDLVAVFRTRAEAADAGMAIVGAGADSEEVVVAEPGDREVVLDAEMHTEFGRGPLSLQAMVTRRGKVPSVVAMGAIGWVVSAVIATLVALVDMGLDHYWQRWVAAFAVIVALGTMVSVLAIGAMATATSDPPLASERGTTLHLHHATDAEYEMLMQMHPWRIDEVAADGRFVPGVHMLEGRSISPPGRHQSGWD